MSSGLENVNLGGNLGEFPEDDEGLLDSIAAYRAEIHEQAQRSSSFWTAQCARIRERTSVARHTSLGWALGSVFAMAALATAMLLVAPAVPAPVAQVDDDVLMRQVYEATSDTLPEALAPATLLANEVDRGLKSAEKKKGESR